MDERQRRPTARGSGPRSGDRRRAQRPGAPGCRRAWPPGAATRFSSTATDLREIPRIGAEAAQPRHHRSGHRFGPDALDRARRSPPPARRARSRARRSARGPGTGYRRSPARRRRRSRHRRATRAPERTSVATALGLSEAGLDEDRARIGAERDQQLLDRRRLPVANGYDQSARPSCVGSAHSRRRGIAATAGRPSGSRRPRARAGRCPRCSAVSQYRLCTSLNLRSPGAAEPRAPAAGGLRRDHPAAGSGSAGPDSNSGRAGAAAPWKRTSRRSRAGSAQRPLEQLTDHPEGELLLEVAATRAQHSHSGLLGHAGSGLEQRRLTDARRTAYHHKAAPEAPPRLPDCLLHPVKLRLAFEQDVSAASRPPIQFSAWVRVTRPPRASASLACMWRTHDEWNRSQPSGPRSYKTGACAYASDSRPCGRSKLAAGRTATSPLGLIIGCVR